MPPEVNTEATVEKEINNGLFNPANAVAHSPEEIAYQQWQARGGRGTSPLLAEALARNPGLLPEGDKVQVLSGRVGKYGGYLISPPHSTFPLAAYAMQNYRPPQTPSVTADLMSKVVKATMAAPQGSPEHEARIVDEWNKDGAPALLREAVDKYGVNEGNRLMATGISKNAEQERFVEDAKKQLQYFELYANIDRESGTRIQKIQEDMSKTGNVPDKDYLNAVQNFNSTFSRDDLSVAQKAEMTSYWYGKIQDYENLDKIVTSVAPPGFDFGKVTSIVPAMIDTGKKDKDGNPIMRKDPTALAEVMTENGQNVAPQINQAIDNATQHIIDTGNDAYGDTPKEIRKNVANMMYSKMPQTVTQTLHNEKGVTVKVGDEQEKKPLPSAPKTVSFADGLIQQDVKYSTSFKPIDIALGSTTNTITSKGGTENTVIGQNAKANGIVMLNVALNKDGSGVAINIKGDKNTNFHNMKVPYVQVDIPTTEGQKKIDNDGNTDNLTQQDYQTVYVPLSQAAGDLINSAPEKQKESMQATIQQYYNTANKDNELHATPQANSFYKKNFLPSNMNDLSGDGKTEKDPDADLIRK